MEAQIVLKDEEIQLLVPKTKAIEARAFMLQGAPAPDNWGGIPEATENAVTFLVWAGRATGCSDEFSL